MKRDRYLVPVAGVPAAQLGAKLRTAITSVQALFPAGTGVCVFTFDLGAGGGLGYISNADRADMIKALEEWIRHQRSLS